MTNKERQLVIPGEIIAEGDEILPGENVKKEDGKIIALKYGLAEVSENLAKVLPVSGVFNPRRGNVVIGEIVMLTSAGWVIDIGTAENAFLSIMEVPRYVDKNNLKEVYDLGDTMLAKIWNIGGRGVDLSIKMREFGRLSDGFTFKVNAHKTPRIIGKDGSMIKLIKENTQCDVSVGQNGIVWVSGETIEKELFAKKAILYVEENAQKSGLTEEVTKWFEENKQ